MISAMMATNDSVSIAPYPIIRVWLSFSIIFGVVPEQISAWNPDSAPQAMVMNRNGNSEPAKAGSFAFEAKAVTAGTFTAGRAIRIPTASRSDGADLHEGRQVVPRRQQQPDRQDRGGEPVNDDAPRDGDLPEGEPVWPQPVSATQPPETMASSSSTTPIRETSETLTRAQEPQVHAHEQGDRDGHRNENTPHGDSARALTTTSAEHRDEDDHDDENADQRGDSADPAEFFAGHLAKAATAAAGGQPEDQEVLHAAGEHNADDDPHRPGQVTHLRGQHRTDQRTGPGDRREVVPEQDPAIGGVEVLAIAVGFGRCCTVVTRFDDLALDQSRIEAVRDDVGTHRGDDEPDGVHVLAANDGDHRPAEPAEQADAQIGHPGGGRQWGPLTDRDRRPVGVGSDELGVCRHCQCSQRRRTPRNQPVG